MPNHFATEAVVRSGSRLGNTLSIGRFLVVRCPLGKSGTTWWEIQADKPFRRLSLARCDPWPVDHNARVQFLKFRTAVSTRDFTLLLKALTSIRPQRKEM
jgi:hypothetical protein